MGIVRLASQALGRGYCARRRRRRNAQTAYIRCEMLEDRSLCSADASLGDLFAQTNLSVLSSVSTSPAGLTPAEIRAAYQLNLISFSNGTVSGTGAGETIAIVDAYNDPNIAADLATFDQEFNLPAPPSFTVDNLGATTTDAGWALETALDVEWAHAIAPDANIVLVEASSSSLASLFYAVSYAGKISGVTVVSMSWGSSEFFGESNYDNVFTTAAGHVNVTYVAASGDSGAYSGPEYPSVSPNVLAVGGTTLTLSASGSYASESGWSGSTGGLSGTDSYFSSYESEPSYQAQSLASVGLSYGVRTTPDVSFNADPSSGVAVYDSVGYGGQSGWFDLGGTSAAAPAWAGLVAIADQGLATGGHGSLSTAEVLTDLYSLPSSDFNDITTGSNGYSATTGYDLVTGLGTPRSNVLVAGILAANGVSESSTVTSTTVAQSTTNSSSTSSSSSSTTTTTTASPHKAKKTKAKHTKVVVQKTHKVARKADLGAALTSSSTSATSESSSSAASATATSAQTATAMTSLAPVAESIITGTRPATTANSGTIATTGFPPESVNQSFPASEDGASGLVATTSFVSTRSQEIVGLVRNFGNPEEQTDMTRPTFISYEPTLSAPDDKLTWNAQIAGSDEFDEALERVAASPISARNARLRNEEPAGTSSPAGLSGLAPIIGAGAVAAAAYQFVLRPPDDVERHSSWCSKFPRS
jgi:subtilase family serine protease